MHSTKYILGFVVAMTTIVAVTLTTLREVTKEQVLLNEAIFNRRFILKAVEAQLGGKKVDELSDEDVANIFETQMEALTTNIKGENIKADRIIACGYKGGKAEDIDMAKEEKKSLDERIMPLYVYTTGADKFYILSIRGNGLWDKIWGCIALEKDLNTIVGASFDHKGETPGLGAEIKDNPVFARNLIGTKINNNKGEYVSISVRKGGARDKMHEIDGISGATITCDGVSDMLYKGIKTYEASLKQFKR